jgi:hypothetical protein
MTTLSLTLEQLDEQSTCISGKHKLPYTQELRTSKLLDCLEQLFTDRQPHLRKKLNNWLYSKSRPNFYLEIKPNLHLAYLNQRDGHGTQHWWKLFYDEQWQALIETTLKGTAIAVADGVSSRDSFQDSYHALIEWGGMFFRSLAEVKIAEALDRRQVLFFANVRGRVSSHQLPISDRSQVHNGRIELDFSVFYKGKCMVLEVDGKHHRQQFQKK